MSNQAPSNWKTLIRPYKAYLRAIYPSPSDATPQLKQRYWSLKAKKSDFNWFGGKPMPRIRADMASAIERSLKPMTIADALSKRKSGDSMNAKVFIHTETPAKPHQLDKATVGLNGSPVIAQEFYINVPVNSSYDKSMFNKLMRITKGWAQDMSFNEEDWKERGMPQQHPVREFFDKYSDLRAWLTEKHVSYFSMEGSRTKLIWWVIPSKARAHLRPKKTSRAGPAYNHPSSNCAIEAIELAMMPIDAKQTKILTKLKTKFSQGVYPDDYEVIARQLNCHISITFAPSSDVAKRWVEAGHKSEQQVYASFGASNKKVIRIHHWANHATAMLQKPAHNYRFVTEYEMAQEVNDRYEQIYQTGENHITFRNSLDGVLETIQLRSDDGVDLDLGKTSSQSQLYDEFKKQIVAYSYNDPNRESYDQFCKHGIHFSIGGESQTDYDLDLKRAYSNYHKMPYYRGLPRDITYWVNNPTIDQIKANSGFVLTRFTDPIKNCEITAWLACCAIDLLNEHNLIHEIHQAAFAHATFELDTTKFIGDGIGKRVFHKILGLSTQIKSNKTYITSDPIEVFDHHVSQIRMPSCIEMNDDIGAVLCNDNINVALSNHVSIGISYNIEKERYSHVAATIQDVITTELWRKWLEIKQSNPNAVVITALVDGIRLRRDGFDYSTFNDDNGNWVSKPTDKYFTQPQCDWVDRPVTKAKIAADQLTRIDWPIQIKDEFVDMLSVSKDDELSFVDLAQEKYINSLQGFAGCGKSYSIRALLEQFNAVILTPTHSTREDMGTHSIRKYIDDEVLNTIPCKTYQSVIQRAGSIRDYQVIIIDEAGMLLAEHLNRIVEMAQRKLILLVGDPAQHKPILNSKMILEAKYLMYRDYIDSNDKLNDIYQNGSDWERNNMLSYLEYDSTFEEPERDENDSDEGHFDKVELLRAEYIEKQRKQTKKLRDILAATFDYTIARDIPAFDTYSKGRFLDVVKRADSSEDGKALVQLCADVRKNGINAILNHCNKYPECRIDTTYKKKHESIDAAKKRNDNNNKILVDDVDNNTIISFLNDDVDTFNDMFKETLYSMSDKTKTNALRAELREVLNNGISSQLAKDEAAIKLRYAFVDTDIRIIAKSTISIKGDHETYMVYNGTKGVMRNFKVLFDGCPLPVDLTQIVKPTRKTKRNPFRRHVLKVADVKPLYAITSYRAQGRTMSDGLIYVNCGYLTFEMLYVAVSRARRLSQLRFIYEDFEYDADGVQVAGPQYRTETINEYGLKSIDNELKLGFKVSNSSKLMVTENDRNLNNLSYDWLNFDWIAFIARVDAKYDAAVESYKIAYDAASDLVKHSMRAPVWIDFAKDALDTMMKQYFDLKSPKAAEPKAIEHKAVEPKAVEPKAIEPKAIEPKIGKPLDKFIDLFGLLDRNESAISASSGAHLLTRGKYYQMIDIMTNEGIDVVDQKATIIAMLEYNKSVFTYDNLNCEPFFTGERATFGRYTIEKWIKRLKNIYGSSIYDDIETWIDLYQSY